MLRFLDEQDGSFRNAADELFRVQTQYMFHSKYVPRFDLGPNVPSTPLTIFRDF
jgi:hypothetical protein